MKIQTLIFIALYVCLAFVISIQSFASIQPSHIPLTDSLVKKNLSSNEVVGFVDTKGISPEAAVSLYETGDFSNIYEALDFDNATNLKATYWMAIPVASRASHHDWYLELHDPHLGHAEVYEWDRKELKQLGTSGFYMPFRKRTIQHKNHFFLFTLPSDSQKLLLVKFYSPSFAKFSASIVSSSQMVDYSLKEYWFLGLYYGALFILLLYNFVLFLNTRQKSFLWYSIFVATCILSAFREDGLGFQFLWPSYPGFNSIHFDISTLALLASFTGFSCSFLDVRQKVPRTFRWLVGLCVLYGICHCIEVWLTHEWFISSFVYPFPFVVVFFLALSLAAKGDKPSMYFLVGFTAFILGVVCFMLRVRGIVPSNVFTIYAPNFSVLSEVIIMSYALSGKYRLQQELLQKAQQQEVEFLKEKAALDQQLIEQLAERDRWKESINKELEKKVAERTLELQAKNLELSNAYKELSFYKERLESDWAKLDKEKWELSKEVKERILHNIQGKEVSFEMFGKIFPTNDVCLQYLSQLKWSGGYTCKQCGHTKFTKGDLPYSRKCTRCTHRETVTAGTLFHGVKIDLTKAFYITHLTHFGNGTTTVKELSEQLDLRPATCWNFKKKVESAKDALQGDQSWERLILLS